MGLVKRISNELGWPLGIRGTCRKYLKVDGTVPSTDRQHFFLADNSKSDKFSLDYLFKNSVRKCVEEYSHKHSCGSLLNEDISIDEGSLPVLYLFKTKIPRPWPGREPFEKYQVREPFSFSCNFVTYPTFCEAEATRKDGVEPSAVFPIDSTEGERINQRTKEFIKENIDQIIQGYRGDFLGNLDGESYKIYNEMTPLANRIEIYEDLEKKKEQFKDFIPESYLIQSRSLNDITGDVDSFLLYLESNPAMAINVDYRDQFYRFCSKSIMDKINKRFN
ncbi:MAG: hypothetical protein ABIB79_04850 [archaeon]